MKPNMFHHFPRMFFWFDVSLCGENLQQRTLSFFHGFFHVQTTGMVRRHWILWWPACFQTQFKVIFASLLARDLTHLTLCLKFHPQHCWKHAGEKGLFHRPRKHRLDLTRCLHYPTWWTNSLQLKMAIEIVDLPIKNGDFPLQTVSSPEGIAFFRVHKPLPIGTYRLHHVDWMWAAMRNRAVSMCPEIGDIPWKIPTINGGFNMFIAGKIISFYGPWLNHGELLVK